MKVRIKCICGVKHFDEGSVTKLILGWQDFLRTHKDCRKKRIVNCVHKRRRG